MDRDSVVGRATNYGLDGPEIEYQWVRDFLHTSKPVPGAAQPPIQRYNGYRIFIPGVKRQGRDVDHPPHPAPRLKKE